MRKWIVSFCCLCLVALATPALAGYVLHMTESAGGNGGISYVQSNRMAMDMGGMFIIIDLNDQTATIVNPKAKAYWKGPIQTIADEVMGGVQKQMEKLLVNVPPEQREMMKQMMKQKGMPGVGPAGPPPKVSIKKTGKVETIAGYKAAEHQVIADGQLAAAMWIDPKFNMRDELDMVKLEKAMAGVNKMGGGKSAMDSPAVAKLWTKGYPLKQVFYHMGQASTVTVHKVEKMKVPAGKFQPPAGYAKGALMDVMMAGQQ